MPIKEKLDADLVTAMKGKQELKTSVLRMLKAAILKFEVAGEKRKTATDDEILQIIGKEVKQRRDSIDAFKKGNREDLASKEETEMKILQGYLPAQLSDDELRGIVKDMVAKTGATSKAEFGKVIGAVMAQVKGKADGQAVSRVVGEFLK